MRILMAMVISLAMAGSALADTLPGSWTENGYSGSTGARNYYLYVPKNTAGQSALPLMVMLHGCTQDAQTFAAITGMNQLAEQYGFAVVYPEQTSQNNMMSCWNWFMPENQKRDSGELAIVVGIVRQVQGAVAIDPNHIYVAGLSAGAALASNLIACYSDVFAGAGIHSGLEFEAATSEQQAFQVQSNPPTTDLSQSAQDAVRCSGAGAKMPAVIVLHGTQDTTVNPNNSNRIVEQMTAINDLLDDGAANNSQNINVIATENGQVPNGHSYTIKAFGGAGVTHIAQVLVDGMGHAWSGAYQSGQFADPQGPNASQMIWLFLTQHSLSR